MYGFGLVAIAFQPAASAAAAVRGRFRHSKTGGANSRFIHAPFMFACEHGFVGIDSPTGGHQAMKQEEEHNEPMGTSFCAGLCTGIGVRRRLCGTRARRGKRAGSEHDRIVGAGSTGIRTPSACSAGHEYTRADCAPQSGSGSNQAADTEQHDATTEIGTQPHDGTAADAETHDGAETAHEAAEDAALASKAKITADQAKAAALAANPGATVTKAELGDENGTIIYSVELNNGDDVKVDAQSGAIIGTDKAGAEETHDSETNDGAGQQNTTQQ